MCHQYYSISYNIKITSSVSSILLSLLNMRCGKCLKVQTSITFLKCTLLNLFLLGACNPFRYCFVAALIPNLYSESLIRAFSSGWNAQHSSAHTRERKISKPHTLLLDHFTIKCHQLHLLICQVTVTLAIRAICASFLHSAELLVLVAQLPSLHWHWTRDSAWRKKEASGPVSAVRLVPAPP